MQPTKTASQIITDFELQVSDVTELSSSEELAILNRVYQKICSDRPWEFLKKQASGAVLSDATSSYITVPDDFAYFTENANYTDNTQQSGNFAPKVIFIVSGTLYSPYQIINFSDRRQYINRSGFVYFDAGSNIIRFTSAPVSGTYEFDYIKVPAILLIGDTPVFSGRFHDIIVFGMAVENEILQLSPKATSYAKENNAKYEQYLLDMQYHNAQLQLA